MGKFRRFYTKVKSHFISLSNSKPEWIVEPSNEDTWYPPPREVDEEAIAIAMQLALPEDRIQVWGKVSFHVPISHRDCSKVDSGQVMVTHNLMADLGEGHWYCHTCGLVRTPGQGRYVTVYEKIDGSEWEGDDEDDE